MELRIYLSLIGLMFTLELFSCSPAPNCQRNNMNAYYNMSESKPNMAVLGGTEDTHRKYNYMVRIGNFDQPDCAGVLVAELWVLTTGHCIDLLEAEKDFKVYGGGTFGTDEQTKDIVASFSTNDDPGNSLGNKIGLIKLNSKFDKGVSYAKVAKSGWPDKKKEKCTYVGYGRKREGKIFVTSRKVAYIDMEFGRDETNCGCRDEGDDICLKNKKGKGPCRCNGGAIICDGVVKGLNRFIGPPTGKCGSGSSDLGDDRCGNEDFNLFFSNVGNFHNWILSSSNGAVTERPATTKGGGGKHGKSDSSITKSNSYMHIMLMVCFITGGLK